MICFLNILFNHPVSEATPNSKITGAYYAVRIHLAVKVLWKLSNNQCFGSGFSILGWKGTDPDPIRIQRVDDQKLKKIYS